MSHKHRVYFAFSTFFQCFSQYSRSYSVCVSFFSLFGFLASGFFLFFTFLNVSRHISSPIGCVFHFSKFFSFFIIFQGLRCSFLIIHNFQCFSPYSRSNSVFVSFYSFFSFLAIILILSHFSRFWVFLAIFHVLQCLFFIFITFPFSRRIPGPTVCISYFPAFSVFLAIIQVLHCVFLFFHVFQCYLPYFTSYSVHFSFSTLFSVSRHIPGQTIFVFHFSRISVFSP